MAGRLERMPKLMLMDWDFRLMAEFPGYTSLQLTRSYYGLGSFEMRLHPKVNGAAELEAGRVLFFSNATHKAMVIDKAVRKEEVLTVSGKLLKGIAARRICVPPVVDEGFFGWDRFMGSAEAAYHHYAAANLYAPEDEKRRIERLVGAENLNRGMELPWQSRFGNLEALFADIGEATEMGWDILPDFSTGRYVFGVTLGRDLTSGRGKVVVSAINRNAKDITFTKDKTAMKTTAYVGGSGEDENRLILSVGNEEAGRERRETWVDAGSIYEMEMLQTAGQKKLDGAEEKESLTCHLLDNQLCAFERDYDIGDKVIVVGSGLQVETRLLEVREGYSEGARTLQATFGKEPVTAARELREALWPTQGIR